MCRYSDILYVKESKAELSNLAHLAAKNDKYRPETCCIIGNYYSLKVSRYWAAPATASSAAFL